MSSWHLTHLVSYLHDIMFQVCEPYVVTLLNLTAIFEWYMASFVVKNGNHIVIRYVLNLLTILGSSGTLIGRGYAITWQPITFHFNSDGFWDLTWLSLWSAIANPMRHFSILCDSQNYMWIWKCPHYCGHFQLHRQFWPWNHTRNCLIHFTIVNHRLSMKFQNWSHMQNL